MRTVMCFGDSNTHGSRAYLSGLPRHGWDTRWPGVMAAELGDGWHVIEEGQPGRTTVHDDPFEGAHRNGLTVLPALLESHQPLDLVVIMLGTNDLKNRFGLSADDIARGAERLATLIRTSAFGPDGRAPDVMLVSPARVELAGDLAYMFDNAPGRSAQLPAAFARAAKRLGVPMLDATQHVELDPADGVHLTANGQRALGKAIAAEIRRLWP